MMAAAMATGQLNEIPPPQNEVDGLDPAALQKIDLKVCEEDQNCMRHVRIANIIRLHA